MILMGIMRSIIATITTVILNSLRASQLAELAQDEPQSSPKDNTMLDVVLDNILHFGTCDVWLAPVSVLRGLILYCATAFFKQTSGPVAEVSFPDLRDE